jgi:hypothetical protein
LAVEPRGFGLRPIRAFVMAKLRRTYLPRTPVRIRARGRTVAAVVEEDLRPVVRLDHALEVGQEGAVAAPIGVVRAPEPPGNAPFAAPFGREEELAFGIIWA